MKLLFLSDLHIDANQRGRKRENLAEECVHYIQSVNPDKVVIAGDLSNDVFISIRIIEKIEEKTNIPVYFIPGNHDIWVREGSSWESYETFKNHKSSLIDRPLNLNENTVLIGDIGWYDYSFKPDALNKEEVAIHKRNMWNDSNYAKWGMSDQEFFEKAYKRLEDQFERNKNKNIIFVNHFVPYRDFIVVKNQLSWDIGNAFMGSEKLGQLIDRYDTIRYVVFGHTHKRFGTLEYGGKKIICNPVGYSHEWETDSFRKELKSCGTIIQL